MVLSAHGDGVNITARIEALAEGGGVCISSTVHDAVKGKKLALRGSILWASSRSRTFRSRSASTACAPSPSQFRSVLRPVRPARQAVYCRPSLRQHEWRSRTRLSE